MSLLYDICDELTGEDDFLGYLPDDSIACEEWLDTCPCPEHDRIVPWSDSSDDSLSFVGYGMYLTVTLICNLRCK